MNSSPTKFLLHYRTLPWVFWLTAAISPLAWADPGEDKAAISQRLHTWAAAFNARDAAGVCDLFAPDLIASVPGAPDADRDAVCGRLSTLLAKPGTSFHYSPEIHEIILDGDLAVVRLTWTLTTGQGAERQRSQETGMDVFQRQADGRWSIIRFVAFPSGPDSPTAD